MTIYKLTQLTLPPTLEKRRDVLEAFRTLVDQDDALVQQRRAEIAAIRREAEDIRRCIDAILRQARELRVEILKELKAQKYSPDQPRVPAGSPHGGEWTSAGNVGSSIGSPAHAVRPAPRAPQDGPQYAQADTGTRTDGVILVQGKVTPRGYTLDHAPGDPLDPQKVNKPVSPDEQQKIADTLTLILNQQFGTLYPHPYKNYPDKQTGAALPPSAAGYIAFDVPGVGGGGARGEGRIVIDAGSGAMYYTNTHYHGFYRLNLNPRGE